MKPSAFLAPEFNSGSRERGVKYYHAGWVTIRHGDAATVEAEVSGPDARYEVEIDIDDDRVIDLWCDCPYFESTGPCKHLWATLLAAEAAGYLTKPAETLGDPEDYDLFGDPIYAAPSQRYRVKPEVKVALPPPPPKPPEWLEKLNQIGSSSWTDSTGTWPADRQILYVIDVPGSVRQGALIIDLLAREPKRAGGWKKPNPPRLDHGTVDRLPDPADRHIIGMLTSTSGYHDWMSPGAYGMLSTSYRVLHPLSATLMPLIAGSGRAVLQLDIIGKELLPLAWDAGGAWQLHLSLRRQDSGKYALRGTLRRGDEEMDVSAPVLVTDGGLVFTRERVAPLEQTADFRWIALLRQAGGIAAPKHQAEQLLAALLEHPLGTPLEVPEELRYEELRAEAKPCLTIRSPQRNSWNSDRLRAQLSFDYGGWRVPDTGPSRGIYDPAARTLLVRDATAEDAARQLLSQLGFSAPDKEYGETEPAWGLAPKKLPAVVRAWVGAGWHIEAEGKIFRSPGSMRVEVASGIDWFELRGEVDYGETTATLPELLAALRRGENMVRLGDGTYGLLPEEWLGRFGSVAGLGQAEGGHLRFKRNQAGLLDALLAAQPEARCDEAFARVRDQLHRFDGIRAAAQPEGFDGQLRDYQREGVGWMEFLRAFGFGGCLADDMGVGKTAQVLALLENRRALRAQALGPADNRSLTVAAPNDSAGEALAPADNRSLTVAAPKDDHAEAACGPSLVVVPKSLVFNWKQEAARFTPQLRVLDHTGVARSINGFSEYDLILTTYGTLRRDAVELKDLEFDYIVLDEAQAIKNADTESAKAVRLLRGRNRLALSGTPVENHLGELWSLFEFLNPGMLGAAPVFKLAGGAARNPGEETRRVLAHALRPFILRRTKEQVARELPAKTEQTIYCELEAAQRKLYNELRAHYRNTLLRTVEKQGLAKSQMQVLEALLRLRQAACHPGLLDAKRLNDPSAKLDLLMYRLDEVAKEGHKALVFSQFTSLLAIVRRRLEEGGLVYEYLDGATRDRQVPVERFQNDPACRLFLISLRAGGLGLNLTAAEYVFLLDPWWNPAVEAQAVDRAHRIGQTRQVFAYRLIARDTVEEKVLELQKTKRDLAAAIISEDNSPLRNLQREDLELLLS
jgi:superfamily II DNA or RNA helicase